MAEVIDGGEVGGALRAPRERLGEGLDRARPHQGGGLAVEAVGVEVPGFVDGDAAEERDPVRVGVVHRDLERTEGELARSRGLVARDHVGDVVRDEHRGRAGCRPGR